MRTFSLLLDAETVSQTRGFLIPGAKMYVASKKRRMFEKDTRLEFAQERLNCRGEKNPPSGLPNSSTTSQNEKLHYRGKEYSQVDSQSKKLHEVPIEDQKKAKGESLEERACLSRTTF